MNLSLAQFLRRRRPDRIVVRPSGAEWKRPEVRPWAQLADVAGAAEAVEAFHGDRLLGIWRPPLVDPAPRPASLASPASPASPASAAAAAECPVCGRTAVRVELEGLREVVRSQTAMLRDVTRSHALALRAVRGAAGIVEREAGDDDQADDQVDDDDDLDGMVRTLLAEKIGLPASGMTTKQMLRSVLRGGAATAANGGGK